MKFFDSNFAPINAQCPQNILQNSEPTEYSLKFGAISKIMDIYAITLQIIQKSFWSPIFFSVVSTFGSTSMTALCIMERVTLTSHHFKLLLLRNNRFFKTQLVPVFI